MSTGAVPGVEAGVLLGFPCPCCHRWARPSFEQRCGHYVCILCHVHVDPACLEVCYQLVRAHMPRVVSFN